MKTITLTETQGRHVLEAIDICLRVGGLKNGLLLLPLAQEVQQQIDEPEGVEADQTQYPEIP